MYRKLSCTKLRIKNCFETFTENFLHSHNIRCSGSLDENMLFMRMGKLPMFLLVLV